ncbi:hypothetical protein BC830DRAFT_1082009 [Chytriomyces sp. MP71]|nr:hypothetical protein BC830DRAFT_1082009 [Chytriomyces sp. MP71]
MIPIHHKRTRVSYSVRSEHSERTHSSGVNALALDVFGAGSLYSGGRDAAVHGWSLQMDFAVLREEAEASLLNRLFWFGDRLGWVGTGWERTAANTTSQDLNIIQNQAPSQSQNNAFSPHPAALQMSPQRKFSAHSDHIAIPPRASTTSAAAPVPTSTTEMLSEYARLSHPAPQPSHPASNHRILNTPQKHSPSLPRSSSLASPSAMLLQRNQNTIGDSALDASHSPQSPHPPLAHAHAAALQKKSRSVSFVGFAPLFSHSLGSTHASPKLTLARNGTVDASADVSLHGPIVNEYTPSMRSITPHHHNPRWVPTNALSSSPPTTHSMAHPYQQRRALLPTVHARSFQAHSDWVNDIVLCNRNQSS